MKKVYLYGTGSGAEKAYTSLENEVEIIGFLDSDENKRDKLFLGYKIFTLDDNLKFFDYIIVCSQFSGIYFHLLNAGVDRAKIINFYDKANIEIYEFENEKRKKVRKNFNCEEYTSEILTNKMIYSKGKEFDKYFEEKKDYVRYKTLYLLSQEIINNNIEGEVAEVGVYKGEFACEINRFFAEKKLYLFDTFEGFDSKEETYDIENGYTSRSFLTKTTFKDTTVQGVIEKLPYSNNCEIRKGYFPETAEGLEEKFSFVSIDVDLYKPIFSALEYFYPRLSEGGYLMIHDYNHIEFEGVKQAIKDYESYYNIRLRKVPMSDRSGSIVISK